MTARDFQIGDKARITKGDHKGKLGEVCIRHFKTDEVTFVEYLACPEIRVKAEFLRKV